jgi:putative addiction module killer protein
MVEMLKTSEFDAWLSDLKDRQAAARIVARIDRLAFGNAGDVKPVGSGVSEMRVDYGPGYRVYYQQRGSLVVLLLCGVTSALRMQILSRPRSSQGSGVSKVRLNPLRSPRSARRGEVWRSERAK